MNLYLSNNFLSKNLRLFKTRFAKLFALLPEQVQALTDEAQVTEQFAKDLLQSCNTNLLQSKSGALSATQNEQALHSAYNPQKEAERLLDDDALQQKDACVFFGCGLGYAVQSFVQKYPKKTLVLVEPELLHFLLALYATDWESVFAHNSCVMVIAGQVDSAFGIMQQIGTDNCHVISTKNYTMHNSAYFAKLAELIERNKQKDQINMRTLQKFSHLWLRNMCKNAKLASSFDGIMRFKDAFKDLPALVIAAGPSLDDVLESLKILQQKTVTICVDTALRACISAGIEPDFIVSVDPQYWNARHLDRLTSPKSILITELASYPQTLRFNCKEILLCSSLYPLGKFLEKRTGDNGALGAGGSVATSAWDFARFIGCSIIYIAGLDLSFPDNKTHFKGSTFEEQAVRTATRLNTVENASYNALYGAYPYFAKNYLGGAVLTDKRMSLYAWWFESQYQKYKDTSTRTITPKGLAIPGICVATQDEINDLQDISAQKNARLLQANASSAQQKLERTQKFALALQDAKDCLKALLYTSKKALNLCQKELSCKGSVANIAQKLSKLDADLRQNQAAELAALVFPCKESLEKLTQNCKSSLETSCIIYQEIIKSVNEHLHYLP